MSLPHLDDHCGQHFSYRNFVECGETWERTRVDNVPKQRGTYDAIRHLVEAVLDPIASRFGKPRLTYAFASPMLSRHIRAKPYPNVTPRGDQHASCELTSRGTLICPRQGMAVDLFVPDADSRMVATWAALNTPFDRIYFYGPTRPFHISHGPERTGLIVRMNGERGGPHQPGRRLLRSRFAPLPLDELMTDPVFA